MNWSKQIEEMDSKTFNRKVKEGYDWVQDEASDESCIFDDRYPEAGVKLPDGVEEACFANALMQLKKKHPEQYGWFCRLHGSERDFITHTFMVKEARHKLIMKEYQNGRIRRLIDLIEKTIYEVKRKVKSTKTKGA